MHLPLYTIYLINCLSQHINASPNVMGKNFSTSFADNLLHESMDWLDTYYDEERGYLFNLDSATLVHDTRSSVWYAAGLLARNAPGDTDQAVRIVNNVIRAQFANATQQW
jgi:hypothetical protein